MQREATRYPRPNNASRYRQQAMCPWHSHWISSVDLRAPPWAKSESLRRTGQRNHAGSADERACGADGSNRQVPPLPLLPSISNGLPPGRSLRPVWLTEDAKFTGSSVYRRDFQPGRYGRPFVHPPMRGSVELLQSDDSEAYKHHSVSRAAFAGYDDGLVQYQKQTNDRAAKLTSRCVIAGSYNFATTTGADSVYDQTRGPKMRQQLPIVLPPLDNTQLQHAKLPHD